jgi:hypothetical protein
MSHVPTPQPRPALRKAPDGSVHPASAVLSSLSVAVPPGGSQTGDTGGKKGKKNGRGKKKAKASAEESTETVALEVELPKSVRKALRKRASDYGWTAEEAAAYVLRVWADN